MTVAPVSIMPSTRRPLNRKSARKCPLVSAGTTIRRPETDAEGFVPAGAATESSISGAASDAAGSRTMSWNVSGLDW